ncbi:MAG TPA: clostripain-related cysteine peptidase [Elusimicrobiales bacterium]|nr:clostripain-related cysteine peptidase [Elusimicrobiales bacterium]
MNYPIRLFCALILAAAPACAGTALEELSNQTRTLPPAGAVRGPQKPGPKEWTIMVYMNGKSNIEPFALGDMNRFETIGSSKKINIVTEIGRSRGLDNDTTADGDWAGVRRYFVTKDQDKDRIASTMLQDLGNPDMGDWKEAAAFLKWARAAYPAKKYLFIIWDHGWGWIDPKKPGENLAGRDKSISHDFVTGNYIATTDMGKIFREAGKVDLYVSMACFMQMAEVSYEIKDGADIIVGSEEVIQLPSLNFEDFLAFITANPAAGAEAAAVSLVDTFREMYARPENLEMLEKTKYGVQLSAVRAAKLPEFAARVKAWYQLAMAAGDKPALARAKAEVLRFEVGDETTDPDKRISFYGDLYNFVELAGRYAGPSPSGRLAAAGEELKNFIAGELTVRNVWLGKDRTGKQYSNAHGIGIQIPGRPGNLIEYYPTYSKLAFEKASGWDTFVKYLETIAE